MWRFVSEVDFFKDCYVYKLGIFFFFLLIRNVYEYNLSRFESLKIVDSIIFVFWGYI